MSTTRLGPSAIISSMQERFLFGSKFVGSDINCDRPSGAKMFAISLPNLRVTIEVSENGSCKWVFTFDFGI